MVSRASSPRSPRVPSPVSVLRLLTNEQDDELHVFEVFSLQSECSELLYFDPIDDLLLNTRSKSVTGSSVDCCETLTLTYTIEGSNKQQLTTEAWPTTKLYERKNDNIANLQLSSRLSRQASFNLSLTTLRRERANEYNKYFKEIAVDGNVVDHRTKNSSSLLRSSFHSFSNL